jgi:hypothetical protein
MLLAIALLIITQVVIPLSFLVWLWRGNNRSRLDWLIGSSSACQCDGSS